MDPSKLQSLQRMQLHHSQLLFIIAELFKQGQLSDDQKYVLKFGVLNDDSTLMDFYYENTGTQAQ